MSGCTIELDADPGIRNIKFRYLPETSRVGVGEWHTARVRTSEGVDHWYGLLAGDYGLTELHEFADGRSWCVILRGSAYVIFCRDPEISDALQFWPVIGSLKYEQGNILILNSFTDVCAISANGILWESERLFTDDLVMLDVAGDTLKVQGWNAPDDRQEIKYISLKNGLAQR